MRVRFCDQLWWTVLCAVFIAIHMAPSARADVQYTVTNLGALPGDTESWPTAINNLGQVVGYSAVPGLNYNAWLYSNGSMTSLGNPAYPGSKALALNNVGQVVGTSSGPNLGGAFVSSAGNMQYIGNGLVPTGINDSGTIVGSYFVNADIRGFVYTNGIIQDFGTLPGGVSASANAINDAGQIAGESGGGGVTHAVLYSNGVMQDLGTLSGGSSSGGYAINNLGDVAGSSRTPLLGGIDHAFLYTQSAGMIDIGQSLGNTATFAYGVNDSDLVVGYINGNGGNRAFLYSGGVLYNLNDLIDPSSEVLLDRAIGINDAGQIIAQGATAQDPNGTYAFLLTPTPEPGAGVIVLGTICGFVLLRGGRSDRVRHTQS